MEVTEIRLLAPTSTDGRLLAYGSVCFDGVLVVHDCRVVRGPRGLLLSCPSRKASSPCHRCGRKGPITDHYCSYCGVARPRQAPALDERGRAVLHHDVAHPVTSEFRAVVERAVFDAYHNDFRDPPPEDAILPLPAASGCLHLFGGGLTSGLPGG